jgi:hypothetical protein
MKALPLVIAASLAANAALLALVLTRPTSDLATATATSNGKSAAEAKAATGDPKLWSNLTSTHPQDLIARLRAAGFPPATVRAIIAAQIRADYAARIRALAPNKGDTPFWKNAQPAEPKIRTAIRELYREQEDSINRLFGGPDPDRALVMSVLERRQYGDLPADKVAQLTNVKRDYDEMRSEIYEATRGGTQLPEDRAKLALLDKEQHADLAGLLTPQELADYDLRTSNTANMMRYNLSVFNPTETEFRSIYALQSAFDEHYGQMAPGMTPDQMRQRNEAQQQLNTQIKTMLGTERGTDFERSTDFAYRQAALVAERLDLPKTAVNDVWSVKTDIEQRARSLSPDLSPADRATQMAALAQEANAKVTASLGQKGFDIYKQNGGSWLQALQPRPARANPATNIRTGIRIGP